MLKKRKVILMTKLAVYEKLEAKHMLKATKYFRGDYISWNVIKTIAAITIVYLLCAAMWLIYNSEFLIENIALLNYYAIISYAVALYVVLVLSYGVISYIVYTVKYRKAVKSMEKYEKGLKQLAKICVEERRGNIEDEDLGNTVIEDGRE